MNLGYIKKIIDNKCYIDNKIKYIYLDGNLNEKFIYYDTLHSKLKKYTFRNDDNLLETIVYNRDGKCIEQYIEIDYKFNNDNTLTKRKSKIFNNDDIICECSYIVKNNDTFYYFINNFIYYNNTNIIECNFNNNGELHGKYVKKINNHLIKEYQYDNNSLIYYCEYENDHKKIEYKLIDQNINKYIEYYNNNTIKRIYNLKNNKFIYDYIEYHPNNILYRQCYFSDTLKIENLKIYDINGNIIYKPSKINKSFIRYPKKQLYPFINHKSIHKNIYDIQQIKKNIINYISLYLCDNENNVLNENNVFCISYNFLRVLSGIPGFKYSF